MITKDLEQLGLSEKEAKVYLAVLELGEVNIQKIAKKSTIKFYEGNEGIKEVYKDTLNYPDQELLAWVSQEAVVGFDVGWLDKYYISKRLEKKIWVRVIAPDTKEM